MTGAGTPTDMTHPTNTGDTTMAILEAHDLRKTYHLGRRNDLQALRGVDFSVEPGEIVAIMGRSGSGKSTLMHILGLLHGPDLNNGPRPRLRFEGRDVVELSDRERTRIRARRMGFVFQDFNLVPTLTALENVMLATDYAGIRGAPAKAAALEALALVGLAERADHRPAELSGGEQQRVAIARALVNKPTLVLADEPTGNLDSERAADVMAMLRRLNREQGQTFVIVTHDAEVGQACDRVVRMRDGRVEDHGLSVLRTHVDDMEDTEAAEATA
jgi:putative ABC transport system ATP-binding protein